MSEQKEMRLSLAAKKLNVGITTIVEKLLAKGHRVENNPNAKLNFELINILAKEYGNNSLLEESTGAKMVQEPKTTVAPSENKDILYFRNEADTKKSEPSTTEKAPETNQESEVIRAGGKIQGITIVGKIDLDKKVPTPKPAPEPKVVEEIPTPKPTPIVEQTPVVQEVKVVEPEKPMPIESSSLVEKNIQKIEEKPVVQETVQPIKVEEPKSPSVATPQSVIKEEKKQDNIEKKQDADKVVVPQAVQQPKVVKPESKPEYKQHQTPRPDNNQFSKQNKSQDNNNNRPINKVEPKPTPKVDSSPKKPIEIEDEEPELIQAKGEKLQGLKVLGRIELPVDKKSSPSDDKDAKRKRKRKRMKRGEKVTTGADTTAQVTNKNKPNQEKGATTSTTPATNTSTNTNTNSNSKKPDQKKKKERKEEVSQVQVKEQIKQTMARMQTKGPDFGAKYRKDKRRNRADQEEQRAMQEREESNILKVTEFISAADLASLMDVSVTDVISAAMKMGMFVSINQRLDAESIQMLALEFNYDVQFISAEEEIKVEAIEKVDAEEDLLPRAPIVTIMGHVDHGKTSLLDYIRRTKVASGEAGGITQHIGAYSVEIDEGPNKGKKLTFLDTPGHEAFTAMRARGAKITDIVIIVVAADDSVMPQTREAINHALNAGVPIVFAINKIDKEGANVSKIREDLSKENILVESWGGKYQEQEVSAKKGIGIDELLDKVLLEAELLDLKANPNRTSVGAVIEASLDKGRGYVTTVMVQNGTLRMGDVILAGQYYGKVKAMVDATGKRIKSAGPSTPVQVLGLPGAPQAGDKFNVMDSEREARDIANKREQINREQSIRAKKHITLEEIGRRKAIGNFHQLNVIVKGDVDGSVEALSDSLLKLSTEQVQVSIIHKGVGQISESDVLLASTADAIVVGFQVRPSSNAKRIADQEEIEIRLYSIIYDAINEIRDAMEGLLAPKVVETVVGTIDVREVFKISKVGTIAGCYVTDGNIKRQNKVRIIREGIVIHEGDILQLKRYKDDVNEVRAGFECGLSVKGFNEIEIGDTLESYELKEVKVKL